MAVYKSTYCYPFLNPVDVRVAKTSANSAYPVQYLKCKVDTSNKNITGYKIRLLDEDNTQIFPVNNGDGKVSSITELQKNNMLDIYEENGNNSGINGTYLQLPFFQSYYEQKLGTYNAIYYKPMYRATHAIISQNLATQAGITLSDNESISNWDIDDTIISGENCLVCNSSTLEEVSFYKIDDGSKVDTQKAYYYTSPVSIAGEDGIIYQLDGTTGTSLGYTTVGSVRNNIVLDGEIISSNQIIFVGATSEDSSEDASKIGFYIVTKLVTIVGDKSLIKVVLRPIDSWNNTLSASSFPIIVNIKDAAKFHNTNWSVSSGSTMAVSYVDSDESMWCDYNGNAIAEINMQGNTYKWEITLYQGDCDVSGTPSVADYQNVGNDAYDMVIGTGSVCGSYSERIQIASDNAFLSDGSVNEGAILPGLKTGTLILQTRYISLSNLGDNESPDVFTKDNRSYVKSYVDSYGYVYPETTNLTTSIINNMTHAQFFKHSNIESEILDSDIVDWGTNTHVDFLFYSKENYTQYSSYENWISSVSVSNRFIVIGVGSLPNALSGMSTGEKVLLVNQGDTIVSGSYSTDFSYQNGVYRYYTLTHNSTTYHCLERAASYTSWSAYIGKIIYVRNGSLGGTNQQCLAAAGTYTLWDPLSSSTLDDSGLGFTTELPIMLFQSKLKNGRTYDFYSESETYPSSGRLDNEELGAGNIVLCSTGAVYKVNSSGTSGSWSLYPYDEQGNSLTPGNGDYVYFLHGSVHAQRVFIYPNMTLDWSLHTARILQNGSSYTYISPSILLKKGMKLKLTHNHAVTLSDSTSTNWLSVLNYNKTLSCVHHETLLSPAVLVSDESTDNNTPWKYEIRTYFKSSDENPFYIAEAPYLILYKNNYEYSDITMIEEQTPTLEVVYRGASVVSGRSVKFSAKYIQFQDVSWESYRWVLKDSNGNILQDTGKKYDKDMSVIFYGLANDMNSGSSSYTAEVYVEDALGNNIQESVDLSVIQSGVLSLPVPLTADYDCDLQAIKLSYQGDGVLSPSFRIGNDTSSATDYKYNSKMTTYWDGGLTYSSQNGDTKLSITGKDKSTIPLVDYSLGSTISCDDGIPYRDYLSLSELYGVNYYSYFDSSSLSQPVSSGNCLNVKSQEGDNDTVSNQLYFETQVTLSDNFCGDILSWQLQGCDSDGIVNPYVGIDGSTNEKGGYLEFKISTYDDSSAYRNKMKFSVTAYEQMSGGIPQAHEKSMTVWEISLFNKTSHGYYYLQPASAVTEDVKTSSYEYLHASLPTADLYVKRDVAGNYFAGGEYGFGNLCLFRSDVTNPKVFSYWVEERPLLAHPKENTAFLSSATVQLLLNKDKTKDTSDGFLVWGDSSYLTESLNYWSDGTVETEYPLYWDSVTASNPWVVKLVAMDRHYGMSDYSYHIICRVKDSDGLYNALVANSCSFSTRNDDILLGADGVYGSITILKVQED